jgi:hypothetical protein
MDLHIRLQGIFAFFQIRTVKVCLCGRIILKWIFETWDRVIQIGLI